jgi:hypothetical protein
LPDFAAREFAARVSGQRHHLQGAPARFRPIELQMMLEPVNRGRFEKSEPTIIDGQDLDIPTFMRRTVR